MPRRRSCPPREKKLTYQLIAKDGDVGRPMYALLDELVSEYHDDLERARIALAWCTSWKSDVDGHITIGKCKRASDLDRELAAFDFVILLSQHFWTGNFTKPTQRRALLDHELCHAAVKYDEQGEPKTDAKGRTIYRTRKHDIEEFEAIVERHGLYKRDLERFALAIRRAAQGTLPLEGEPAAESGGAGSPPPRPTTH